MSTKFVAPVLRITRTGVDENGGVVDPWPSCARVLSPTDQTMPSPRRMTVWRSPAATLTTPNDDSPANGFGQVAGVGFGHAVVFAIPIWPRLSSPHPRIRPGAGAVTGAAVADACASTVAVGAIVATRARTISPTNRR